MWRYKCSSTTLYVLVEDRATELGKRQKTKDIWMSLKTEDDVYPFKEPEDFYAWIDRAVEEA